MQPDMSDDDAQAQLEDVLAEMTDDELAEFGAEAEAMHAEADSTDGGDAA